MPAIPAGPAALDIGKAQTSLLREQVVETIRAAIIDMRLSPGQRITERQVVESSGVSRATAREALRHLAAEGLVTTIPQRGIVVAAPDPVEARDIYEVRAVLEGLAGRLCARNATEEQLGALRDSLVAVEHVLQDGDATQRDRLDAKAGFFDCLFAGADNPTLMALLGPLRAKITVLRATSMARPGRDMAALREIRSIVAAVESRNEDAAFAACTYHVKAAADAALSALAE